MHLSVHQFQKDFNRNVSYNLNRIPNELVIWQSNSSNTIVSSYFSLIFNFLKQVRNIWRLWNQSELTPY